MKIQSSNGSTARRLYLLLLALFILVVADGLITSYLVSHGIAGEGNLLLRGWVDEWYFPLIKTLGALFCGFLIWDIYRRWPRLAILSSISFVIFYGAVVLWNSLLLFVNLV